MLLRVLIATATPQLESRLRRQLRGADVVVSVQPLKMWDRVLADAAYDQLIVDREAIEGPVIEWLDGLRESIEVPPLLLVARVDSEEESARWLAAGCWGVLSPQLSDRALRAGLTAVTHRVRQRLVLREVPRWAGAGNVAMPEARRSRSLERAIRRMASTDSAVLIRGEAGVGRTWVARAIHAASRRSAHPFVAFHCRQVAHDQLNAALFGGGSEERSAVFCAQRGTLWLEGIEALPLDAQEGMLRLLQDRVVEPQGESPALAVDVRVMASLPSAVDETPPEGMRADLYYRLANVSLMVPPLRERRDEIPDLLEQYSRFFADELGRRVQGFAHDALNELVDYAWPGNVRELINLVERSVLLCRGTHITLQDLPESVGAWRREHEEGRYGNVWTEHGRLRDMRSKTWREVRQEVMDAAERSYLAELLRSCEGKIGETAARAGMLPRALYAKMKQHGLRKEEFRPVRRRGRKRPRDETT